MTFLAWLRRQGTRQDPIGDLARDTQAYERRYGRFATEQALLVCLTERATPKVYEAYQQARAAFDQAPHGCGR